MMQAPISKLEMRMETHPSIVPSGAATRQPVRVVCTAPATTEHTHSTPPHSHFHAA